MSPPLLLMEGGGETASAATREELLRPLPRRQQQQQQLLRPLNGMHRFPSNAAAAATVAATENLLAGAAEVVAEGCKGRPASAPSTIAAMSCGQIYKATTRRKSVFAETYDPEEDEQDEKPVVHPKSDSQRKSLLEAVKEILLFRSLDQEQLGDVLDAMFERAVDKDDYIIRQGDDGDNFYVVESGTYNIYVNGASTGANGEVGSLVGSCKDSGSFGELALMYNMPRAATVQAASQGMLWAMDRQTFRRIVLRNAFQKRKMYESLLESVPLLSTLNPYERMNLADALTTKKFTDGSQIVKQGDPADGMYFIESGVVDVMVTGNDGTEKQVTTIRNGGYFGELALVPHKPRAATVIAKGDIRVAFLDVNAFERLLGPCMDVMKRNVDDYEEQLVRIFGSKANISDIR